MSQVRAPMLNESEREQMRQWIERNRTRIYNEAWTRQRVMDTMMQDLGLPPHSPAVLDRLGIDSPINREAVRVNSGRARWTRYREGTTPPRAAKNQQIRQWSQITSDSKEQARAWLREHADQFRNIRETKAEVHRALRAAIPSVPSNDAFLFRIGWDHGNYRIKDDPASAAPTPTHRRVRLGADLVTPPGSTPLPPPRHPQATTATSESAMHEIALALARSLNVLIDEQRRNP